jgi:hypothetical protein
VASRPRTYDGKKRLSSENGCARTRGGGNDPEVRRLGAQNIRTQRDHRHPFGSSRRCRAGFYIDAAGNSYDFTDERGSFLKGDYPGTPFNQLLGQNDSGQAVATTAPRQTALVPIMLTSMTRTVFSSCSKFPCPPARKRQESTMPETSADSSLTPKGVNHGWVLTRGEFDILNVLGSTGIQALGLNNKGQMVGSYIDSAGNSHGFVNKESTKTFQSVDDPDGVGTTVVNGINDKGDLVGFFGAPINSGFVATPSER